MNPQEDVLKRLQGIKDPRGLAGEMARGKNMYPGGNAAQSGPGGPDMGRPPTNVVPPAAMQAVLQRTGMQQQPQAPVPQPAKVPKPQANKIAKAALQAAAKRKLQR